MRQFLKLSSAAYSQISFGEINRRLTIAKTSANALSTILKATLNILDTKQRTGVSDWMRDALAKIVANRPEDPVTFLSQYFDNIEEKNSKVTRAYQLLILTDHTRLTFQNNVSAAYEILSLSSSSKSLAGLTGAPYRDLLNMICRDIPSSIYDKFLKKVGPRDHELIPYCVFYPGVVAAFILVEYYQRTQALFSVVCSQKDSDVVIDRYLAETLVTVLNDSIHSCKSDDPLLRVLEAGAKFGEEELADEILDAMNASQSSNRPVMKQEEFLDAAINIYLNEVKPVR